MFQKSEWEDDCTIRELKQMASDRGIKKYGYMRKSELLDALGFNDSVDDCYQPESKSDSGNWWDNILIMIVFVLFIEASRFFASVLFSALLMWILFGFFSFISVPLQWVHLIDPQWVESDWVLELKGLFGVMIAVSLYIYAAFFAKDESEGEEIA
jgi:hypothetical protein